jgi:hypothetical protein
VQLLGFPIQLIGVLSLPLLYTRYVAESNNIVDDIGDATVRLFPLYHSCKG